MQQQFLALSPSTNTFDPAGHHAPTGNSSTSGGLLDPFSHGPTNEWQDRVISKFNAGMSQWGFQPFGTSKYLAGDPPAVGFQAAGTSVEVRKSSLSLDTYLPKSIKLEFNKWPNIPIQKMRSWRWVS